MGITIQPTRQLSAKFVYAAFGAVLGASIVVAATLLALHAKGTAFALDTAMAAHASQAMLWFFDAIVPVLATLGFLFGQTQDRLDAQEARIEDSVEARTLEWEQRNQDLMRQITEQAQADQALRQAMEEADSASRAHADLMAALGHDIRAPMHGVLGMIELMLDSAVPGKQDALLRSARESGQALLSVLGDTLEFSRAEAGQLGLAPSAFSVRALVDETVASFQTSAARKFIHIAANVQQGTPDTLYGDARRIRQVLGYYLANALTFTNAGSVELQVHTLEDAGGQARIRFAVKDTGVGLDEAMQQRLFQDSGAAAGANMPAPGRGMGLAVAKRLVSMMGGEIGVQSEAGKGSTFWFSARFPKADASSVLVSDAPRAAPELAAPLRPLKVLVAEDNPVNQLFARAVLESEGHQVELAANGREALDQALHSKPDLILMDCQMPVMDGYEATRQIRSGGLASVRIFALTANARREDRDLCIAAGMDDYLSKPYSRQELAALLRRWFETPHASSAAPTGGRSSA